MPHDRNGREVQPGDRVTITGVVESVQPNTEFCNTTIRSPYLAPFQMGFCATLCTAETELAGLTFRQLAVASAKRLADFKTADGTRIHVDDSGTEWSALEWAGAMCGEAGEAANLAKKLKRGDFKLDDVIDITPGANDGQGEWVTAREAMAKELADTVCYAEALARRCGIDLDEAIRNKFNQVSTKIGSKVTL